MLLVASAVSGQVRFEVDGRTEVVGDQLRVHVELRNREGGPVFALVADGELAGQYDRVELDAVLPEGDTATLTLRYPARVPRPGRHALILRIDYHAGEPPAPEGAVRTSQLAFVVFPLGGNPAPALDLATAPAQLRLTGSLPVELRSLDGVGHRVLLRIHTARGLGAHPRERELELPASGRLAVPFRLLRSGAATGTRHGVLVEAQVLDGPLARTSVAAGVVEVGDPSSRARRLRVPLLVLAAAAIAAAAWVERRRRVRSAR